MMLWRRVWWFMVFECDLYVLIYYILRVILSFDFFKKNYFPDDIKYNFSKYRKK